MCAFQKSRGLLVPAGRVLKCLQSKTKHFLFEAGSSHRWLPERRTSSVWLSLTPTGTDDGAECHPSPSLWDVTKNNKESCCLIKSGLCGWHPTYVLGWRLSNAPSWSIKNLKLSQNTTLPFRDMIATSKQILFFFLFFFYNIALYANLPAAQLHVQLHGSSCG